MKNKHIPTTRHKELSLIFLKMGRSLVNEGLKNKDYVTASLGNSMIFMSSAALDINEVKLFVELCNMMSSRRMVIGIRDGSFDIDKFKDLKDIAKDDPFQEIIRKIKRDIEDDNPDTENKD